MDFCFRPSTQPQWHNNEIASGRYAQHHASRIRLAGEEEASAGAGDASEKLVSGRGIGEMGGRGGGGGWVKRRLWKGKPASVYPGGRGKV